MANRIVKVILRGEIGDLRGKMAAAGKSVKDTADKMTAAGKESEKFRRGLDDIGSSAGKMGLVAAAGLGAIVVASSNFESSMSSVQAATHESVANMERLRDAALEAGKATAFSATEAAAGIENLAKAGVSTADILKGGLDGALALAAAGSIDVAAAAEAAATAMTQFGLKGADVPHIADLLAAAAGKAQGEVSDFNFALAQSGLVANQVGLSIEETTGGLAAFASAGLLGSDAGTSFKTMLGALTPNSDKAKAAMEKLGISAYDTQGNFIGLAEFAGKLQEGMKDLSNEQRQAALETIFGSDAVRAASVIYEQGEAGIRKWITAVDDQGFAAETAAIKMDNLKGDLEELGGSVETVLIGMGEGSQGPLRSLVQGLTRVTNAFGSMPSSIQGTITGLLGITAITGGALWFGSKVIRGVADTREALSNLGVAGSRASRGLGLAVKGLTGLATAFAAVELAQSFTTRGDAGDMQRWIEDATTGADTGAERLAGLRTELEEMRDLLDDQTWVESFLFGSDNEFFGLGGSRRQEVVDYAAALEEEVAQLEHEERAAGLAATAQAALAGATNVGAAVADHAAKKQEALDKATQEARDSAREQAQAWIGLGEGVDDAEVSLQKWLTSLEDQAKALEDFTKNAETAADKGLREGLIDALQEAGPTGALRMRELANATEDEIKRANEAWQRGQDAIKDYVNQEVPPKKPKVDPKPAIKAVRDIRRELEQIPDEVVTIRIRPVVDGSVAGVDLGAVLGAPKRSADGSTVPKDGGSYADRYPYLLAPGEEVISNRSGQADRWRPLLKAINAGMLADGGTVRGYAAGGTVVQTSGMGGIDYGRLAHELSKVRPLYGDVHWKGSYEDFQRMAQADSELAAIGGF